MAKFGLFQMRALEVFLPSFECFRACPISGSSVSPALWFMSSWVSQPVTTFLCSALSLDLRIGSLPLLLYTIFMPRFFMFDVVFSGLFVATSL